MKTFFLFLLPFALLAQYNAISIDATAPGVVTMSTDEVNSAAEARAFSFMPTADKTISAFRIYVSAVGSEALGASDIRAELLDPSIGGISRVVTYDDGADTVGLTAHPFSAGDVLYFSAATTLPAGISATTPYYVCSPSANGFQIDDDSGCASVVSDFSGSAGNQAVRKILETQTTTAAAAGTISFSFATALTAWKSYYIAIDCPNCTATKSFTLKWQGQIHARLPVNPSSSAFTAPSTISSTSNKTGWTGTAIAAGWRVDYSDSSHQGFPVLAAATAGTSDRANGAQEVGVRYTLPPYAKARFNAASLCVSKVGSPAADARLRLYTGANGAETLAATSASVIRHVVSTSVHCLVFGFSSTQELAGGTVVRLMLGSTTAGDSSSNTFAPVEYTIEDDAASKALVYGGVQHAKFDGTSSWTYTDTKFVPFGLYFVDAAEFGATGTSGSSWGYAQ